MERFLKLKDIYEKGLDPTLTFAWWEDDKYIYYVEEYEGSSDGETFWQIDKENHLVRHDKYDSYKEVTYWTEWEVA